MGFDKKKFVQNMNYIEARSNFISIRWSEILSWYRDKSEKKSAATKFINIIKKTYFKIFS